MTKTLQEIKKDILTLSSRERAALARHLINTLDDDMDEDVEELWLKEAEQRYEEYRRGKITAVSAEEAFREARRRFE